MGKFVVYDGEYSYGASEIAGALAILYGMERPERCLLAHAGEQGNGAEQGFLSRGRREIHPERLVEEGMDSLVRLAESGRLSSANISNYTLPVIKGRLDLAAGHKRIREERRASPERQYMQIWQAAAGYYSRIFIEGHGLREWQGEEITDRITLVVLRQNRSVLERFYEQYKRSAYQGNRLIIPVLYPYDEHSVLNVKNVKRLFGSRLPVIGVPYNSDFTNAWNEGEAQAFMLRNRKAGSKKQANAGFINAVRQLMACCEEVEKLLRLDSGMAVHP
jgi:hypothetical protein